MHPNGCQGRAPFIGIFTPFVESAVPGIDHGWGTVSTRLASRCELLLSSVRQRQDAAEPTAWIPSDHLPVRLQLQLHKLLRGNGPRQVKV